MSCAVNVLFGLSFTAGIVVSSAFLGKARALSKNNK